MPVILQGPKGYFNHQGKKMKKGSPKTKRGREKQEQLEAIVRIVANMAFGFNGSDPSNPPLKGLKMAVETLEETIECFIKEDRKRHDQS